METNSKTHFGFQKILKFGISIVHTNMYSHAKVGMQTNSNMTVLLCSYEFQPSEYSKVIGVQS